MPFQRFCLSLNATSKRAAPWSRSSWPPRPNAIALPASRPCWRTRKRRCLPSPTVEAPTASQPATSSVTSGLPRPNGASCSSSRASSSVSADAGTIASMRVTGARSSSSELPVGVGGERRGERLELVAADRQAGGGAMAAEALEVVGAGGEAGVEVEARHRAAGALPAVALARDQDDGAAEPLDEPRGDDPDHALVPALAPDDVGAAAPLLGRPRVDDRDRLAEDPLLDGLAVAVQRLELVREQVGLAVVLRQHEMQADVRPAEPAGGVEPRREPEADGRRVDGGRIDAGDAHQRPQPGLLGARERAQAGCSRARGSRRRAGRRRRSSRARRDPGAARSPDGRLRGAPARA